MNSNYKPHTFSSQILDFYFSLSSKPPLPKDIEAIYPLDNSETNALMQTFFNKYYNDTNSRTYLVGINPGRLGSGITGIGFADAYHLENVCGIANGFDKRMEISASFMFEVMEA